MSFEIGILSSGRLGLSTIEKLKSRINPQFIFTDKSSKGIIDFAENQNIPIYIGNPKKSEASNFLEQFKTDIILSINYLFIVENNVLDHPDLFAINIHGSLLPKYRGRTPHVWAIINGEIETGVSAHLMEKGCDTGDIIMQKRIPINRNQTGANILHEFERIYPEMLLDTLKKINENTLTKQKQDENKASWFGKRTPEDGHINWNWQKERIQNWVRAQAHPYPGAFTKLNDRKVIIDQIEFSDYGFDQHMENGLVVSAKPKILVKTSNGVIELSSIRNIEDLTIRKNDILE
jgi:methionyl-tRNA formyltransferase